MKEYFGELSVIGMKGCEKFVRRVDEYLCQWRKNERKTYLVEADCPRFGTGEAKGIINASLRGHDTFIYVDPFNYGVTYNMYGMTVPMSPDDHFQDLKRIICANEKKSRRVSVIMPMLYEGRQHKRNARESLDCAMALQELVAMGVSNILTFDAHDPRVQNSIPLHGFETVPAYYQFIKNILRNVDDLKLDNDHLMIVSPDEGATQRAVYMASVLGVDMGMFYKRRDYSTVVDGRNPIVAHEFLGPDLEGKDVFVVDDMISSGESMIDVARELKRRKANRVFVIATFGLFTSGMDSFDKAVEEGTIYRVVTTNLTYQRQELLDRDYYISCDMAKYIALIIDTLNHDASMSELLNPYGRINKVVSRYRAEH